jgi:hypothetical protein
MKYILIVYKCLVRVIISDTVFYKFSQIIYLRSNYNFQSISIKNYN